VRRPDGKNPAVTLFWIADKQKSRIFFPWIQNPIPAARDHYPVIATKAQNLAPILQNNNSGTHQATK
jgi:hypothetical protein